MGRIVVRTPSQGATALGDKKVTLGTPGTCAIVNSDDTYSEQETVAPGAEVTHTLPDVDHTDTDGSTVTLPGMTPMTCSAPADGVVDVNGDTRQVASGGTLVIRVINENDLLIGNGLFGPGPNSYDHVIEAQPIHINGVEAFGIIPEGIPFNLKVRLDGTPSGTFDGVDTVNVSSLTYSRLPAKTWRFCYADRSLISGYTGALMQFRRATGGATFDAVQDANGYMNTSQVVTDRGNDNITTPIVYDQAGSGVNMLQAVVANQPRLAVGSPNGKERATIYHAQTPFVQAAQSFALNSTETLYIVCRPNTINGAILCGSGTSWWLEMAGSNTIYVFNGSSYFATTGAVQLYSPCLLTLQLKLNALVVRLNGVQILSQNPFALAASTSVTVGARPTGANPNNMGWQALCAHAGDFDAAIETSLMNIYGI